MASSRIILVALAVIGIAISETMATDFVVGDEKGWTLGIDYQAWASAKPFKVRDKIIFRYAVGHHNVIEVNEDAFEVCEVDPGSETLETGNDIVELTTPGTHFYICGIGLHCSDGNQKFSINVLP